MSNFFYPKLALSNLKKNSKTYVPYLLTCIITTAMFYIIYSLSINKGLKNMIGGQEVATLLAFGTGIIAIFSVIFLFYTNSFLIKRRKKEFGLFNILGMEKKHIGRLIIHESLITLIVSLVLGLLSGISLDKVMFLLIGKILGTDVPLGFTVSLGAMKTTCLLFTGIQILICLNAIRQIHISNPIELLNSSSSGEKEPKSKWIFTLLGIIFVGIGYYLSITTTNPLGAFGLFFVAVLCVIIGTYLLFMAGSITILKLLKKNKNFYYKTNHFISVSGMIYRMKQNAVGLANICILSTMVLVTLSSTISLWVGVDDLVTTRYPREMSITYRDNMQNKVQLHDDAYQLVKNQGITIQKPMEYTYLTFSVLYRDGQYIIDRGAFYASDLNNAYNLFFITLDDYNANFQTHETLQSDEVLFYSNRTNFNESKINLFDKEYKIKKQLDTFIDNGFMMANVASTHYIVVKDYDVLNEITKKQKEAYGDMSSLMTYYMSFDTDASQEQNIDLYNNIENTLKKQYSGLVIESRTDSYQSFIALYGGFMFLGLFLSVLFVMIAILIIYYKQITEGYEDKERYEIMQKVGMDHQTVKKSINSQVLMVFFLPLITAGIHIAFAFPMISRLLKVLMLNNTKLLILCTIGCLVVFGIVYVIVYMLTSKLYYSIVKRN